MVLSTRLKYPHSRIAFTFCVRVHINSHLSIDANYDDFRSYLYKYTHNSIRNKSLDLRNHTAAQQRIQSSPFHRSEISFPPMKRTIFYIHLYSSSSPIPIWYTTNVTRDGV